MTLGAWVEIAYSALFDDLSALANPAEYRTMMFDAFWEGKMPKPRAPTPASRKGRRVGSESQEPPRASSGPSKHALRQLQAETERVLALQAAKQAGE